MRKRLPTDRKAITHRFKVADRKVYVIVGLYDDGRPGELFIKVGPEGSCENGMMEAFATAISIALQHGATLESLVDKFSYQSFEPSGFTGSPDIPFAQSIVDYVFRWMANKFLSKSASATA